MISLLILTVIGFSSSVDARILLDPSRSDLGPRQRSERITNGEEAVPHSIPYQAALVITSTKGKESFCGGTLISSKCVLTAAHCLENAARVEVILGAHNLNLPEPEQLRMATTSFVSHESYTRGLYEDIAIIYLPQEASFSTTISPVKLPRRSKVSKDLEGTRARQSGWGRTSGGFGITEKLQFVHTLVISNELCNKQFFGVISERHICVETNGGKSVCHGDSGGPLCDDHGTLLGIAAFVNIFGCESGLAAAFTRVTSYLDWIERHSDVVIED